MEVTNNEVVKIKVKSRGDRLSYYVRKNYEFSSKLGKERGSKSWIAVKAKKRREAEGIKDVWWREASREAIWRHVISWKYWQSRGYRVERSWQLKSCVREHWGEVKCVPVFRALCLRFHIDVRVENEKGRVRKKDSMESFVFRFYSVSWNCQNSAAIAF